ncbi:single-stranded DNA-binding protein [Streptomyces hirsutus]|uniref:Single-stranded DNA-binding protein n=1 Tax=Streptomyces hirsutus TaxID=35620 RepID=A0ABZ1GKS2_9ACTN|nr:single-stranded DNA-binding protein [Streptomyces hirsutus]WSD06699.1 single-stranded DNA-binding protein [Streptomyces hirsutus]WTD19903.1 single-stranded DNA-binding protein [Streptomyces hirsutus]
MNETMICAVGNVATQPVFRETASGPVARFRLAVTSRYWNRDKAMWADGHTNFFTVWANRQLATNATASLSVGEPVIVQGRLKVRTETREGQQGRTSADLDAVAIGHDLARGTSAFRRAGRPDPQQASPDRPEPAWENRPGEGAKEPEAVEPAESVEAVEASEVADVAEAVAATTAAEPAATAQQSPEPAMVT